MLWLHGPYESTHEFAVHQGRNRIHVDVLTRKELAGVLYAVDSRWLNLNRLESRSREFGSLLVLFECTRNATHPKQHTLANLIRD